MLRSAQRARLEAWATHKTLVPTLRDATLGVAPQGEDIPQKHQAWLNIFFPATGMVALRIVPLATFSLRRETTT